MFKLSAVERGRMGAKVSIDIQRKEKDRRIKIYLLNPTTCPECKSPLPYERKNEKFCNRSCSGKYTNALKKSARQIAYCIECKQPSKPLIPWQLANHKYCSSQCHSSNTYRRYIEAWKEGKINGRVAGGYTSHHIRRYLIKTYGEQCILCTWQERNPFTNKIPLVLDHKDGNCLNCTPDNLRLICNNCDSLSATFKGGNKGKGRKSQGVPTYR